MTDFRTLTRQYVADPKDRILLDDAVSAKVSETAVLLEPGQFSLESPVDAATFLERIQRYDTAIEDLVGAASILGRWGLPEHRSTLGNVISRMSALVGDGGSGLSTWLGLRWYPLGVLLYASGIAAIGGDNYTMLRSLFYARGNRRRNARPLVFLGVNEGLAAANGEFEMLPGHQGQRFARDQFFFDKLQVLAERDLHLGAAFEEVFERFEVMNAVAHLSHSRPEHRWVPQGRILWNSYQESDGDPLTRLEAEAKAAGSAWPPLAAGMYDGSIDRFLGAATVLRGLLNTAFRRFLTRHPPLDLSQAARDPPYENCAPCL